MKLNWKDLWKDATMFANANGPEILIGLGISAMVGGAISGIFATPKAMKKIHSDSAKNHNGDTEAYTTKEAVKSAWMYYIPTVVLEVGGAAMCIKSNSIKTQRTAAVMAAYSLSEKALSEYKEQVKEVIGEKKEKVIEDKVAEKKVKENPVSNNQVIMTGTGTTLCYDSISGRYFQSDMETLRRVANDLSEKLPEDLYITLNEYYYEIGLPGLDPIGENLGWDSDHSRRVEFNFSSQLADDGRPCLVVMMDIVPIADYKILH